MNARNIFIACLIVAVSVIAIHIHLTRGSFFSMKAVSGVGIVEQEPDQVDIFLEARKKALLGQVEDVDIFGEDNIVRILFVGLDSRAGQKFAHCDAIQMLEIDREKDTVSITAVPRGTYAPLPGYGHPTSSYYVSKSCELGGLEYGIKQIERILGKKADYVAMVGFSETLGILRMLKLPTTDTLQWLRHRQSYSVGEPQRARNHSTFLKHLLVQYTPEGTSKFDSAWQYILYKLVRTDMTFAQVQSVVQELASMNLNEDPERITLAMRPVYYVQDIAYEPEHVGEDVQKMIEPIKHLLSPKDYQDVTLDEVQQKLFDMIEQKKHDTEFVTWAHENNLWLQIEDDNKREETRYDILMLYIGMIKEQKEKERILADYILEMEHTGKEEWAQKGRLVLNDWLEISGQDSTNQTTTTSAE